MSQDLRLVPVAAATWVGAWVGVSGWRPEPGVLFSLAASVSLGAVLALRGKRWGLAACLIALLTAGLAAGALAWQRHDSSVAAQAANRVVGVIEFEVRVQPRAADRAVVAEVQLVALRSRGEAVRVSTPIVVLAAGERGQDLLVLAVGGTYRASALLGPSEPNEREAAVASLRSAPELVLAPGPLEAAAASLRGGLRQAMANSPPEQAALVPSLVVGDTSGLTDDLREDFRTTGLSHLLAVSGANLSLMLSVVLAVARAVAVRGWAVRVVAVAGVGGFVLLCGDEPSVLRAAGMGLVALASLGAGRSRGSLRTLSLAVILLLWLDPWLASSIGFALSAAACAGIVTLGPPFIAALTRWCPRWIAEALAVALAAQLVTQPLVTGISGQVSVVGVLANVAAGPFVGPTTVLGFAAAFASVVPGAALVPAWLAGWCAQPIVWVARAGSSLPTAAWRWEATAGSLALVTLGTAALGAILLVALRRPVGGAAFAAVLVACCLVRPVPLGWPGDWSAVFCDVGQGDATAIRAGDRAAALVDTGPEPKPTLDCLASLGVRQVPLLVLTHYHADHTGGARQVIAKFGPDLILVREGAVPDWLAEVAVEVGAQVRPAVAGERVAVGEASLQVVSVGQAPALVGDDDGEGSPENDASVVTLAMSGGLRVLLPGDAEPAGQAKALRSAAALGLDLGAEVLKLPHHGSARQEPRFFEATGAALAVASAGQDNDYGHPAQAALDLSYDEGMQVARTDRQGSIAVALAQARLVVRATRAP